MSATKTKYEREAGAHYHEECPVCGQPALMGFHPRCFPRFIDDCERLALESPRGAVCEHCPFRKDKPFWMSRWQKLMNIKRIEKGLPRQRCHMDINAGVANGCLGYEVCTQGGDGGILNLEELKAERPCADVWEQYYRYKDGDD